VPERLAASVRGGSVAPSGIESLLARSIEAGHFPGAVALAGGAREVAWCCARGRAVVEPEEHRAAGETVYDLAELTQPLVTAPLVLLLHALEGLDLDARLARFLPEIDRLDKRDITLRDLLLHRSGLPEWVPLYAHGLGMAGYLRHLRDRPPVYRTGTRVLPSGVGYILLGEAAARVGSAPLEQLAREMLFAPLGSSSLGFGPRPPGERPRTAATERGDVFELRRAGREAAAYRGWRREVIWGEAHDHATWTLGGVSGSAGLFGAAGDLWLYAREFLGRGRGLFPDRLLPLLRQDGTAELAEGRAFGWQLARTPGCAAGEALGGEAFGLGGFTGASMWIDPRAERIFILLTNRVHPEVRPVDMDSIRREFHQAAAERL